MTAERDVEALLETARVLGAMWPDDARVKAYVQKHAQQVARLTAEQERLEPTPETRDYLTRTIETIRNHRDADNSWPQWANALADEVERLWAALTPQAGTEGEGEERSD